MESSLLWAFGGGPFLVALFLIALFGFGLVNLFLFINGRNIPLLFNAITYVLFPRLIEWYASNSSGVKYLY